MIIAITIISVFILTVIIKLVFNYYDSKHKENMLTKKNKETEYVVKVPMEELEEKIVSFIGSKYPNPVDINSICIFFLKDIRWEGNREIFNVRILSAMSNLINKDILVESKNNIGLYTINKDIINEERGSKKNKY